MPGCDCCRHTSALQLTALAASTSGALQGREGALRAEVGGALRRVRAYTRDVEEVLERERLRLEEVLKVGGGLVWAVLSLTRAAP